MHAWIGPAFSAFLCWGLWAFLPKITTRYMAPQSAIVYEALGGALVALGVSLVLGQRPETDPRGVALAMTTGVLGVLGALGYLFAVVRGPVTLIATVTALYPISTVLLAHGLLHEPVTLKQGVGILLALFAIILIST
jgi:bacterial/archaeal transporter family protein